MPTMLYCHDTYGLGHLRRTLAVARRLSSSPLFGAQLVVTGSPVEHRFDLPPNTDTVKLPALIKLGDEEYAARSLGVDFAALRALRRELILGAAKAFQPSLVIVDHAPTGAGGEMLPALLYLRRTAPETRIVLGLRDVLDEPERVRAAWARDGVGNVLDEIYDRIVVYGDPSVVDVVSDYGLSPRAAAKTRFVGYLRREVGGGSREAILRQYGLNAERLVVVATGGGGDGEAVIAAAIEGVRAGHAPKNIGWVVVTGPLMPEAARRRLAQRAAGLRRLRLVEFVDDLPVMLGAADAIVAMGGYNSICEILSVDRPALIVPRVEPRLEQWIRASRLDQLGLVRVVHPSDLTPRGLVRAAVGLLDRPVRPAPTGLLDGLPRLEAELTELLMSRVGDEIAMPAH